jgi:hypothetical protein
MKPVDFRCIVTKLFVFCVVVSQSIIRHIIDNPLPSRLSKGVTHEKRSAQKSRNNAVSAKTKIPNEACG